jgi:Tfp pilus assembly protein FimV
MSSHSITDVVEQNVIPATVENLTDEQNAEMEQVMQQLRENYIKTFFVTQQGKAI